MTTADTITIETHGRLHFGVLDLRGDSGRWFGGIGAAAPGPTLRLIARPAPTLIVDGDDHARAETFARRFIDRHRLGGGAHITIERALPPHAGLGSGTQLALAVARSLAELHGLDTDVRALALAVGRARRSAIGTWTFARGGLILEGGRPREGDACGPLLARLALPDDWRAIVVVPRASPAMSGAAEVAAFRELPLPARRDVEHVAHLVLMALLPAVADGDLAAFGAALTEVQEITGRWFAPAQGGTFASPETAALIARMAALGAVGVGQSSWGPTVYGVVAGDHAARAAVAALRRDTAADVHAGPFPNRGALVHRSCGTEPCEVVTDSHD